MAKKKRVKSEPAKMLHPIWLDDEDQETVEQLRHSLWATSWNSAFIHLLRWACGAVEKSTAIYKKHLRESDAAYSTGKPLILRLTEEQREHLDAFIARTKAESLTDAVRVIIRMAADHFRAK